MTHTKCFGPVLRAKFGHRETFKAWSHFWLSNWAQRAKCSAGRGFSEGATQDTQPVLCKEQGLLTPRPPVHGGALQSTPAHCMPLLCLWMW